MFTKSVLLILMLTLSLCCIAQEETKPIELELLKTYVGVWDAEIEVWPKGINAASIKFKGVEKNRLYGEHWMKKLKLDKLQLEDLTIEIVKPENWNEVQDYAAKKWARQFYSKMKKDSKWKDLKSIMESMLE